MLIDMQKRIKVFLTLLIIVVVVLAFYFITKTVTNSTGYAIFSDDRSELASCLATKDVKFYVSATCPACEEQKQIFGKSFDKISQVTCKSDRSNCGQVEIVPAWKIDNTFYYGVKSMDELKAISSC